MIKEIKLKEWLNFEKAKFTFNKGINLILGENGSGKTNLLEGIMYALYSDTTKNLIQKEMVKDYKPDNTYTIELETEDFVIYREQEQPKKDYLTNKTNNLKIEGRANVTDYIEKYYCPKQIYKLLVYHNQLNFLDLVDTTPAEKEKIFNFLLRMEAISQIRDILVNAVNRLQDKIAEYKSILKRLENSKEKRKAELLEQLKELKEKVEKVKEIINFYTKQKEQYEINFTYQTKLNAVNKYMEIKKEVNRYRELLKLKENLLTEWHNTKNNKQILNEQLKQLNNNMKKFEQLTKEGKCLYCERALTINDYKNYERIKLSLKEEISLIENKLQANESKIQNLEKELKEIEKELQKVNINVLRSELIKNRQLVLNNPSFRFLKQYYDPNLTVDEKAYKEILGKIEALKTELNLIERDIDLKERDLKCYDGIDQEIDFYSKRIEELEKEKVELTILRDLFAKGIISKEVRDYFLEKLPFKKLFNLFKLGELSYNNEFEFFIDKIPIKACSGGQKVITNLVLKFVFLQLYNIDFVILDEPTIYLDDSRIESLKEFFYTLKHLNIFKQIIIVTHEQRLKEIADNLILLKKEGYYED